MNKQITQSSIKSIIIGLILYIFSGVVGGIVMTFVMGASLLSGSAGGFASALLIPILFALVSIVGLIIYMMGLNKCANQLDEIGKSALKMVFYGVIVTIVAVILSIIPGVGGILGGICAIIAAILSIVGFSKLKDSAVIGEIGLKGAQALFLSAVLFLIAEVVDFIPLLGWVSFILLVLYYIFLFIGWSRMKKAFE